jgi:fibronectin-binding autotransporter adhesin
MRISLRRLVPLLVISATITCVDAPTGPRASSGTATFAISPTFSKSATQAKAMYSAAGFEIDHVRLLITRPPSVVVKDTTVAYTVGQGDLPLELNVIGPVGEELTVQLDYLAGTVVLYSGTTTVKTVSLITPANQVPQTVIVIDAVGPGFDAAAVSVTPSSGLFPTTGTVAFTAKAFTAAETEIQGALFGWSVDDATVATIDATGLLHPTTKGGPIKVRATTLNGVFGEVTVGIQIPASAATKLAFAVQPTTVVAGVVISPAVQVVAQDANGSTVTGFNGAISLGLGTNLGGATLGGTVTANAVNGVATFNTLTLNAAANGYTLVATSTGLTQAISSSFNVTGGAATALEFVVQPSNTTQGATISPPVQVRIRNALGATVNTATNIVTIAIGTNPGGSTLSGNPQAAAVAGVATFSTLSLSNLGNGYTLTVSATGLTGATSTAFNIAAPAIATRSWTGVVSTSWTDPANWAPAGVPTVSDSVVIVSGGFSPTISANVNVRALVVQAGAVLTVGAVQLFPSPGKITNQGTLNLNGSILLGALENQATTVVQGAVAAAGAITNAAGAFLKVQGAGGLGAAALVGSTGIINSGVLELTDVTASYGAVISAGGTLTNTATGTISALQGAGGDRDISGAIDNQGTIAITSTSGVDFVQSGTSSNNSGTISVTNGDFRIVQGVATDAFTNTGTITIASGRKWQVTGGALNVATGTTSGAGTLVLQGVALTMTTASMTAPLTVNAATTIVGGTLTIPSGQELILVGSTFSSSIVVQGTLTARQTNSIIGTLTIGSGSTLRALGIGAVGALTVANGFTNNGTIQLTDSVASYGASLTVTSGQLVNPAGGQVQAIQGSNGTRTLAAELNNAGTIAVSGSQGLTLNKAGAAHTNSGAINVTSGNFTVTQTIAGSFTNTGTISVPTGRTVTVTGGTATLGDNLVTGAGSIDLNAVALSFIPRTTFPVITSDAATTFNGGTLTVGVGEQLTFVSSVVSSNVVVDGMLTMRRTNSITGTVSNAAGSTLRAFGLTSSGDLTIANGFTNNGTIQLTDSVASYGASLKITTGQLVNPAAGQIQPLQGANGSRLLGAELNNAGTIVISGTQGMTLNKAAAAHANAGAINLTTGNLTVTQSAGGSFTNTGTMSVSTGRTLTVTGGAAVLGDNLVTGAGSVDLNAVALSFTPRTSFPVITSDAATVFNGGTLTIGASEELTFVSSTISSNVSVSGKLTMRRTNSITGTFTNVVGSFLRAFGLTSSGDLTIASGFTNNGTIQLTDSVASYGASLIITTGTLTNPAAGSIIPLQGSNGARTITAQLDNAGTITIGNAQGLTINKTAAAHTNSGSISLSSGDLTVTQTAGGSFTNTGAITVPTGRTLTITGGSATLGNNLVTGTGSVVLTGVALSFTPRTSFPVITSDAATVFNSGTLTIGSTEELTFVSSTISSNVAVSGKLTMRRTNSITGTFTNVVGSFLRAFGLTSSGDLTIANGFTNNGTIQLTDSVASYGASLIVTTGTLTNPAAGSIIPLQGSNGVRTLAAQLSNAGTITIGNTQGMTINRTAAAHTNNGTINLSTGNLTLTQSGGGSFTTTGSIIVPAGRTLSITGGTATLGAALVTGQGSLTLTGVAVSFDPRSNFPVITSDAATVFNGGTLAIADTVDLTFVSSTISSNVTLNGMLTMRRTNSITGTLTKGAFSTLRAFGLTSSGDLTIANGFTNNGTIQLTDSVASYGASLIVTNGTLTNPVGGSIQPLQASNGARTLAAQLSNAGTVTINGSQGMTLNKTGAVHTSSGAINLTTGNLTITQSTGGSFTTTGTMSVPTGRTLTITGGTATLGNNLVTGIGTVDLNGVALSFTPRTTFPVITSDAATVFNGGTLTVGAGEQLTFVSSTISSNVSLSGTLTMRRTNSITGTFSNVGGSFLRAFGLTSSGDLTIANGFTNNGTIMLTDSVASYGANLIVTTGTLTNAAAGSIQPQQGSNGARSLTANLTNNGTITISNTQGITIAGQFNNTNAFNITGNQTVNISKAGAAHTNTGTISLPSITSGTLNIGAASTTQTFTNTGTVSVGAGRTLALLGNTAFTNGVGGTYTGPSGGTLNVASTSTFTNAGTIAPGGVNTVGTMNYIGTWNPGASGAITFDQNTSSADQIAITGNATLGGSMTAAWLQPTNTITFTLMSFTGTRLGAFSSTTYASGCIAGPPTGNFQTACTGAF